ncbi:hypothetical protein M2277_002077 [Paenibacillus sp. LBL]|uniref:hypothetical protein n=1 Tax=Paenibacillus TaxID=44249 RepID=UPI00128BC2E0|nr:MULTISPECIES: hypothetical protein [Paenibacillus]MDH6671427.1 hypothetical protein [Paenibacillus sp. LBL]MPY15641.1 hypothetical protein [Paenibacillus glucanolyticus]
MDLSHKVVGLEGLGLILVLLVVNYFIIYLIVSQVIKNSGLKSEITTLKGELENLKELLDEGSRKPPKK